MPLQHQVANEPLHNTAAPEWVDAQDIMQLLHISRSTLKRWRQNKLILFCKIGGKIFYNKTELQQRFNEMARKEGR